jgi:8-oxo-dGTP diphosphatase
MTSSTTDLANENKEMLPFITTVQCNDGNTNLNKEYYQVTLKIPRWHVVVKRETAAWILVGLSSLLLLLVSCSGGDSRNQGAQQYYSTMSSSPFNDPVLTLSKDVEEPSERGKIPTSEEEEEVLHYNSPMESTRGEGVKDMRIFVDLDTGKPVMQTFYNPRKNNNDYNNNNKQQQAQPRSPVDDAFEGGSCLCIPSGPDDFCSCTPSVAIDVILTSGLSYIWVIRRKKEPHKLACMGGFVEVGETPEEAVARELMEETSLTLSSPPRFFGIYSDPRRDMERHRHSVSIVYVVDIPQNYQPVAGDDATEMIRLHVGELEKEDYFIDHKVLLMDYKKSIAGTEGSQVPKKFWSTVTYDDPVKRAVCHDNAMGYTPKT